MSISKQIVQRYLSEHPSAFAWKVPSKSEKDTFHAVEWFETNVWVCDCVAYKMSKDKTCKHIALVRMKFNPIDLWK